MNDNPPAIPTNRNAVISLIAAILTILSICTAVAPIPLTGFICYPTGAAFGLAALGTGLASLRQIRSSGEKGRSFAIFGASIGGLTAAAFLCITILGIIFLPQIVDFVRQMQHNFPGR